MRWSLYNVFKTLLLDSSSSLLQEQLRRNFANKDAVRKGTRQQTFIYKSVTGNYQGPFQELSFQMAKENASPIIIFYP